MRTAVNSKNNIIAVDIWETRIRENKEKRRAELRKHIFQLVFALVFICLVIFGVNSIISKAASAKEAEVSYKYYKNICVEAGDTLSSIADSYADDAHYPTIESYIKEVRFMNHLEEEDKIYAGDYLIIPYYSCELR